jgi:hypothetical protein
MSDKEEMVRNITEQYFFKVLKAFDQLDGSAAAIATIAKSLKDIYRHFEPAFFSGKFFVVKTLGDQVFQDKPADTVYDKVVFLNRTTGNMIAQVFDNGKILFWENDEILEPKSFSNTLIYYYSNNSELLFANGEEINITESQRGSRYATQYEDLMATLKAYGTHKLFYSSCSHFTNSWDDANRLFFKGGGRGNNIPEKFMQQSLYEYLSTALVARGITIDAVREYNINGDATKPKPVDVKLTWREANRVAIIELKFLGTVKPASGAVYVHEDARANEGLFQLKGYHDNILKDAPTTILKSYLLVIEGRRRNLQAGNTTIGYADGMHFKDVALLIDTDKRYYESIPGFENPIKLFAAPITI